MRKTCLSLRMEVKSQTKRRVVMPRMQQRKMVLRNKTRKRRKVERNHRQVEVCS